MHAGTAVVPVPLSIDINHLHISTICRLSWALKQMLLSQEHGSSPCIGRLARASMHRQDMALAAMMVVCRMVSWAIADCLPRKWADHYRGVGVVLPSLPISLFCLSHLIIAEMLLGSPKSCLACFFYLFCSILESRDFVTRAIGAIRPCAALHPSQSSHQRTQGLFPLPLSLPLPYHAASPPSRACRFDGLERFLGL